VYAGDKQEFLQNLLRQESVLLNLQRACETVIDLANLLVAAQDWGIPASSRESFEILRNHKVISAELTKKLTSMVGLRNLLVHQYSRIDMVQISQLIEEDLDDLLEFSRQVLQHIGEE
jgi:uncharacterized protein YutE (UPF0331/DUF86 family)